MVALADSGEVGPGGAGTARLAAARLGSGGGGPEGLESWLGVGGREGGLLPFKLSGAILPTLPDCR